MVDTDGGLVPKVMKHQGKVHYVLPCIVKVTPGEPRSITETFSDALNSYSSTESSPAPILG